MKSIQIAIFHGLGDCVNATTYLRPIKLKHPNCHITWITWEGYRGVVEHNPLVSNIITLNDKAERPGFGCDKRYPELRKKHPNLVAPASYISGIHGDGTLLGSFKSDIRQLKLNPEPFEPLLYVTHEEKRKAHAWLADLGLTNYVLLETSYGSSQSDWNGNHTEKVIKFLADSGYSIVLTSRKDPKLEHYRKFADVYAMDMSYRQAPVIYNSSKGFIGVSSGISCVVHTHQCRKDIPHLEFVRGDHWSTRHYKKSKKKIFHKMDGFLGKIKTSF